MHRRVDGGADALQARDGLGGPVEAIHVVDRGCLAGAAARQHRRAQRRRRDGPGERRQRPAAPAHGPRQRVAIDAVEADPIGAEQAPEALGRGGRHGALVGAPALLLQQAQQQSVAGLFPAALLVGPPPPGDVGDDRHQVLRAAGGIGHDGHVLVHPDRRPIAAHVAVLDLERRDDARPQPPDLRQVRVAIVRVHDLRERERQQLVVVIADDAAEGRVALLDAPLAIGNGHAQRGMPDDAAETALDDAQGAGGALLLGAIEHVIDEQADGAGRVDDGHDAVAHQLAVAGVAADQLDVESPARTRLGRPGSPASPRSASGRRRDGAARTGWRSRRARAASRPRWRSRGCAALRR